MEDMAEVQQVQGNGGIQVRWGKTVKLQQCQKKVRPDEYTDARVQFECYQADQSRQMRNTHVVQKDQWISGDELLFLLVQGHSQFSTFPRDEKGERKRGLWKTKQVHKWNRVKSKGTT